MLKNRLIRIYEIATACTAWFVLAANANAGGHGDKKRKVVNPAISAGAFTTPAAAPQTAGLVGSLKSDGPLTVFAPTGATFEKFPEGTVNNLLLPGPCRSVAGIQHRSEPPVSNRAGPRP